MTEYQLGDPMLWGDDNNNRVGDKVLIPQGSLKETFKLWDGEEKSLLLRLKETFKLWDGEEKSLLLLRYTVLGVEYTTSSNIDLWLRRLLFEIIIIEKIGVDVTEK